MLEAIVLIADPRVLQIPIVDNGEPLVDVTQWPLIRLSARRAGLYPGFRLVRQSVADKLVAAAAALPNGVSLFFEEGHRPVWLQRQYYDRYRGRLSLAHPQWDAARLAMETSKYVAPPDIVPPHSTGAAVDLTLCTGEGLELDMGTTSDGSPVDSDTLSYTFSPQITDSARQNRALLIEIMSNQGFVNYPTEWWHWSYGDRYWAYQMHQTNAIYGTIEA
jgi:D-alanyl-D-alanine dipeptidase